jgi:hypothetical protein
MQVLPLGLAFIADRRPPPKNPGDPSVAVETEEDQTMANETDDVELTPIEKLAYPFLDHAVRIDTAKQNPADRDALVEVLESNVQLWMFYRNLIGNHFAEVTPETSEWLVKVSDFMTKAAIVLQKQPDEELLDKITVLNLNMSEKLLTMKKPE